MPGSQARRGADRTAGTIFFLLNLVFYLINVTMMLTRAIRYPKVFKQSFYDRSEAVWFPTSMLGMATLMIATMLYGIPRCGVRFQRMPITLDWTSRADRYQEWLVVTVEAWFYVFVFLSAMAVLRIQSGL